MYEVQLNGYAYIAENIDYRPVTGLGLTYYEPYSDFTPDLIDDYAENDGFICISMLIPWESSLIRI